MRCIRPAPGGKPKEAALAEPSISRAATGTISDDVMTIAQMFVADELIASGAIRSYFSTLRGASGNDTLTGWQGPENWPGFATGSESLALRSLLQGGFGDDLLISAKRFSGLTALQEQAYQLSETLSGGGGNDTYQLRHTDVVVSDLLDGGVDLVFVTQDYLLRAQIEGRSSISMVTMPNIENLTLQGKRGFDVLGSDLANKIIGNNAANRLQGGLGMDQLYGGSGNDQLWGDDAGAGAIGVGLEDRLFGGAGADQLWGEAGNDVLSGGFADDTLFGGDGNDQLLGDGGNDSMFGGLGNDIYMLDSAADEVIEVADQGFDSVRSSSIALSGGDFDHVEVLQLLGARPLDLSGGGQVLRLIGNTGRNTLTSGGIDGESLYGGGGDDVLLALTAFNRVELYGGIGNDRYYIYDPALDRVHETAGQGFDVVETDSASLDASSGAGYGQNIELLRLLGASVLDLTGGGSVVQLEGNAGANRLTGLANAEQILGGAGNDMLDGGAGNDTLTGGADTDELRGGAGSDRFVFDLISGGGIDYLDDFGAGDVLDLNAAALAIGPGLPAIGVSLGSYNAMTVWLYEFDFDGNGGVDLAFYARNAIALSDLLAGFG